MLKQGWDVDASGVLGPLLLTIAATTAALGLIVGIKSAVPMTPPNTSLERTRER
jgi:hypothetical protein